MSHGTTVPEKLMNSLQKGKGLRANVFGDYLTRVKQSPDGAALPPRDGELRLFPNLTDH